MSGMPDLRYTLAYAKAYLLMRRIGVARVKEAMRFDAALERFDIEMHRIEVALDVLSHPIEIYSHSWNAEKTIEADIETRAAKRRLSEVNTPCSRYVKHAGVWREIGELMRRHKRVDYPITEGEDSYFSYKSSAARWGVDPVNSYWSRRMPKGPRRDT
jgi:hypothetical protein